MEYASSPKWNTDNIDFSFISDIIDFKIDNPTDEALDFFNLKTFMTKAIESCHALATANTKMTKRQVEIKTKHIIRSILSKTISLTKIIDRLDVDSNREFIEASNPIFYSMDYRTGIANLWQEIISTLIETSSNIKNKKRINDYMLVDRYNHSGFLTSLRISPSGKIIVNIKSYETNDNGISATFNLEDITFDKLSNIMDTHPSIKVFPEIVKQICIAEFKLFFIVQQLVITGKYAELVSSIQDKIINEIIPQSDNDEWLVNYAKDTAHIITYLPCTPKMRTLSHFRNKEKLRLNIKISRDAVGYNCTLDGLSFTEYKSSFGLHRHISSIMGIACNAFKDPSVYGLPARKNQSKQDILFTAAILDCISEYAFDLYDTEFLNAIQKEQRILSYYTVKINGAKRRIAIRAKPFKEDRAYVSERFRLYTSSQYNTDTAGYFDINDTSFDGEAGYYNTNDTKYMYLMNKHDMLYRSDSDPVSMFNIITNEVFWSHWSKLSTGEIYYIVNALYVMRPEQLKYYMDIYLCSGDYSNFIESILHIGFNRISKILPAADDIGLTLTSSNLNDFKSSTVYDDEDELPKSKFMLSKKNRFNVVPNVLLLTSPEFVAKFEPRKFLPPAIKRMVNITTAFPKAIRNMANHKHNNLFKSNDIITPDLSNLESSLNILRLPIPHKPDYRGYEHNSLLKDCMQILIHMCIIHAAGNRIGTKLTMHGKLVFGGILGLAIELLMDNKFTILPTIVACARGNPFTTLISIIEGKRIQTDLLTNFSANKIPAVIRDIFDPAEYGVVISQYSNSLTANIDQCNIKDNIQDYSSIDTFDTHAKFTNMQRHHDKLIIANDSDPVKRKLSQLIQTSLLFSTALSRIMLSPMLTLTEKHNIEALCHPRYSALSASFNDYIDSWINKHVTYNMEMKEKVFTWFNLPKLDKAIKTNMAKHLLSTQSIEVLQGVKSFVNAGKRMVNCVAGRSYSNGRIIYTVVRDNDIISHFYVLIDDASPENRFCIDIKVAFNCKSKLLKMSIYEARGHRNHGTPSKELLEALKEIALPIISKRFNALGNKLVKDSLENDDLTELSVQSINKQIDRINTRYINYFGGNQTTKARIYNEACKKATPDELITHFNEGITQKFNSMMETLYIFKHNKAASSALKKHKFIYETLAKIANNSQFTSEVV